MYNRSNISDICNISNITNISNMLTSFEFFQTGRTVATSIGHAHVVMAHGGHSGFPPLGHIESIRHTNTDNIKTKCQAAAAHSGWKPTMTTKCSDHMHLSPKCALAQCRYDDIVKTAQSLNSIKKLSSSRCCASRLGVKGLKPGL